MWPFFQQMKFTVSLKKNIEFQNLYNNGKKYANKYLVMYVLSNNLSVNRIGFSISKKVGNSVVRHHIARLLRESYRLHEEIFSSGLNIVIIARKGSDELDFYQTQKSLMHLMKLHNIVK